MITGTDLRRYRKAIGLNQVAFARRLGASQSSLSAMESGRTPVSDEYIDRLRKAFSGPQPKPPFGEFLESLKRDRATVLAAAESQQGRYLTLTTWRWDDTFDLIRTPTLDQALGMVTIRATDKPAVALAMGKATAHWAKGEILVFEQCLPHNVYDGDTCLLHARLAKTRSARTLLALAHVSSDKRGQAIQFEPISPAGPIFSARDDTLVSVLRCIYRAKDMR